MKDANKGKEKEKKTFMVFCLYLVRKLLPILVLSTVDGLLKEKRKEVML